MTSRLSLLLLVSYILTTGLVRAEHIPGELPKILWISDADFERANPKGYDLLAGGSSGGRGGGEGATLKRWSGLSSAVAGAKIDLKAKIGSFEPTLYLNGPELEQYYSFLRKNPTSLIDQLQVRTLPECLDDLNRPTPIVGARNTLKVCISGNEQLSDETTRKEHLEEIYLQVALEFSGIDELFSTHARSLLLNQEVLPHRSTFNELEASYRASVPLQSAEEWKILERVSKLNCGVARMGGPYLIESENFRSYSELITSFKQGVTHTVRRHPNGFWMFRGLFSSHSSDKLDTAIEALLSCYP